MKNKIAVLVCGQLREFNIAFTSWSPLLDLNCDFYFSTWNKSSQSKKKWVNYLNIETEVTKNMITESIPNAIVSILNEDEYDHFNHFKKYKITDKQILHWKNSLNMCLDSGIEYDVVIVTRPDVFFELFDLENFINDLKENRIGVNKNRPPNFFEDIFFMGKFKTIKRFIENIKEHEITDVHTDLYKHLIHLNMSFKSYYFGIESTEVRPITNELYLNNISYETIKLNNEEFIIKYHKKINHDKRI